MPAIIGIIGANGRVGTEACLFLSRMHGVRVRAICRTTLGSAFLRRCGIDCVHGSVEGDGARALLDGCDVVADFALPAGPVHQLRATTARMVSEAQRNAPAHARYVYISSEMAYGMRQEELQFRKHLFSRTTYGGVKRFAERLAFRLGRQLGREVFVLRLGQMHGLMQSESRRILNEFRHGPAVIPDAPSDTVFAFTVAEALAHIAQGLEQPGRYTLVSEPQWSWREMYEFYARESGFEPQPVLVPPGVYSPQLPVLGAWRDRATGGVMASAMRFRETFANYLLWRIPALENRLTADHRRRRVRTEFAALQAAEYRPCNAMLGTVLGARLRSLSDSRETMPPLLPAIRKILQAAGPDVAEHPGPSGRAILNGKTIHAGSSYSVVEDYPR